VRAAYEARTEDELNALSAGLPQLPITPEQRRAELVQRRGELQRRLIQQAGGGLVPFAICTVIWLAAGAHGRFGLHGSR
jgi:hypothetical protein